MYLCVSCVLSAVLAEEAPSDRVNKDSLHKPETRKLRVGDLEEAQPHTHTETDSNLPIAASVPTESAAADNVNASAPRPLCSAVSECAPAQTAPVTSHSASASASGSVSTAALRANKPSAPNANAHATDDWHYERFKQHFSRYRR